MKATRKRLDGPKTRQLHDLGFGIHWLKPKSKMPVEDKWTTGARKTWPALESSYRRGMNVGVRLGTPSKIGARFLAVIDCDVKSKDPAHEKEMREKLLSLHPFEDEDLGVVAMSGRGNGSMHVYVLTSKPVRPQRLAQSPVKVKVHMPSSKSPSKYEVEHLSEKEIQSGIRIRAAWEISLMGEGQQVVLPPSIHPDSGMEYEWGQTDPRRKDSFRHFAIEQKAIEKETTVHQDFEAVPFDLIGSRLHSKIVDMIISGDGVEDASAALLGVCNAMVKAQMADNEILSVLTEKDYFLGEVAYRHAQTSSRARAARWVRSYTLDKSKKENSASEIFNDEVEIEDNTPLSEEEADAQLENDAPELEWQYQVERSSADSGARPKNTLRNVLLILQGEGGKDVVKRDEFANSDVYGADTPWGGKRGAEFTDTDTILIKDWLSKKWKFEPSNDRINEAIIRISVANRFHPVRDYIDALEWDGTPRIDTWMKRLLSAQAREPYLSAVSRKTLVAMIARIYNPGIKYDTVLILEGNQGRGKSRALNALAGDGWFTDAQINVGDKDAILVMRSIWLIELGELSSMSKADVEALKAFISTRTDRIRVPYGKRTENFPRQCIFIGSTNQEEYLKDTTGNRRYWPVKVGVCNVDAVSAERDQLFAEAKFAYDLGETLWLDEDKADQGAQKEQASRELHDSWEDLIADWITKGKDDDSLTPRVDRDRFRTEDLFDSAGPLANWKLDPPQLKRCSDTLRKMGFVSESIYEKAAKRNRRFWLPKNLTPKKEGVRSA